MYLPPEGILILTIESSKPDQEGNFQNGEIPTASKNTMCDFQNFGLVFVGQCTVCLKSMLFEIFSHSAGSLGRSIRKKFQTALSHKNETKIVKITHSA